MNIKYVSPSYKRPNDCPILDYLSKVKVYVSKEDYKDYVLLHKKKKDNIIALQIQIGDDQLWKKKKYY